MCVLYSNPDTHKAIEYEYDILLVLVYRFIVEIRQLFSAAMDFFKVAVVLNVRVFLAKKILHCKKQDKSNISCYYEKKLFQALFQIRLYALMRDIQKTINDCKSCSLVNQCVPSAFDDKDLHHFSKIVTTNERYADSSDLFQQGGSAQYLYVVKSGGFKTCSSTSNGSIHIHEFFLPGELIGLESMAGGVSLTTATATEDSVACRIDYLQLVALRKEFPILSDLVIERYGQALAASQVMLACISNPSAASRVASFILIILERLGPVNSKSGDVYLNISRNDIANHLGLAGETVSRAFAKLVSWGYITKSRRHIHILDADGLKLCASNTEL